MGQLTTKIGAYLDLADEVLRAAGQLIDMANAHFSSPAAAPLTPRDRVLIALARKVEGALRALMADARLERSETMHHLKTMVEAFIYYHVVASDDTQRTAMLVSAKTYHDKVTFFRENAGYVPAAELERWEQARDERLRQVQELRGAVEEESPKAPAKLLDEVKNLERLAQKHSPEIRRWYARVYRLACEPAHLGDLQELMPGADGWIAMEPPATAEYRAAIAIDMALQLCIGLMATIGEMNEPGRHGACRASTRGTRLGSHAGAASASEERRVVVPGYGMAVAQAQHAVAELGNILTQRGVRRPAGLSLPVDVPTGGYGI